MNSKYVLRERLVNFSAQAIKISERFPKTVAASNIAGQIARSASSPALHYGKAQGAESAKDFIHKMKGALKELRETYNAFGIADKMAWLPKEELAWIIDENNQLISMVFTSVRTAERNLNGGDKPEEKNDQKPNAPVDSETDNKPDDSETHNNDSS